MKFFCDLHTAGRIFLIKVGFARVPKTASSQNKAQISAIIGCKKLQIWQTKLMLIARFVENVKFFEKFLMQKFLFLYIFKEIMHKI